MTNMDLLELFGAAEVPYILEAQRLRSGEKTAAPGKKLSSRRLWLLVAAIIAAMALAIPTYAAIQRIQLRLTQKTEAQPQEEEILLTCYPQFIPEGYSLTDSSQTNPKSRNLGYQNGAGQTIDFFLSTGQYQDDLQLRPPVEETDVDISGNPGTLRTSGGGGQHLIWKNEDAGYWASLFTDDTGVDLAAIARSVAPGEPIPFSVQYKDGEEWESWYPQWVPEGYTLTDVSPVSDGSRQLFFTKDVYDRIQFMISTTRSFLDTPPSDPPDKETSMVWEDVQIGADPGRLLTIGGSQQILYWSNAAEGFHAMLMTKNMEVELLAAIAESVGPGESLEVTPNYLGPDYKIDLHQEDGGYAGYEPVYPQTVPEGYEMTFVSDRAYGEQFIRYENADGEEVSYTLYFRLGQYGRGFEGMGEPEPVKVSGHTGYRIVQNDYQSVIWTDEERGFGFQLSGAAELDLLAVANSVAPGPELTPTNADWTEKALEQLGNYQITALPEGMVEDGLAGSPLEGEDDWYSYVRRWYFDRASGKELFFEYETYLSDYTSQEEMLRGWIGEGEAPADMVTINGCPGAAKQDSNGATVLWILGDLTEGTSFKLYSKDFSAQELTTLAESAGPTANAHGDGQSSLLP